MQHLHPESKAEVLFALSTGLRAAELKRATWAELEMTPELDVAAIPHLSESSSKSRAARFVPISQALFDELNTIRREEKLPASMLKRLQVEGLRRVPL